MAGTPTTAAAPSRIAERTPGAVRTAAFALAVLLIEALLAAGLVNDRFARFLLLFGAVAGLAIVVRFSLPSALAMLAFTDFIFASDFFTFSIGPVEARPFELVLVCLLAVAFVQPRRHTWGGVAGMALAGFLLLVGISAVLATTSGRAELVDVLNWGRPLVMLTFFYVVVRLFPDPSQRRTLLLGAAVIAAVTGVVAVLVSLGWSFGDTLKGEGTQIVREEEGIGGVQRVRLPGLSLGYALFWYAAVQVVANQGLRRGGWALLLAGIAVDVAVSFNRNMWLGIAAGLLLLIVLGGTFLRGRLVVAVAVAVAALSVVTLVGGSDEGRLLQPVVQRASTILSPGDVTRESSLQDRQQESDVAWEAARENLVLGVGVGADFGLLTNELIGANAFVRTPQLFLHNQYIYLLLIGGVGGLLAFLVFLGAPIVQAFRRSPRDPLMSACAVGIAMIMASSTVAIYFTIEDMTAVLALLAGVIVAGAEDPAGREPDSGPGG